MLQKTAMKNILFLILLPLVCAACKDVAETKIPAAEAGVLTARLRNGKDELIARRLEKIAAALRLSPPILTLGTADENQQTAQDLAVKDARFTSETKDAPTGEPLFK